MVRQRVFEIALGCEDLNDLGEMLYCPALQTAVGRDHTQACAPTWCRLENPTERGWAGGFHLSSASPEQNLFRLVAARLEPGLS